MGDLTKRDRDFLTGGITGTAADKLIAKFSTIVAEE